jgi:malonate transporter and related proteins
MGVVLATVLPVFGLMLTGYLFARTRMIEPAGTRGISVFVFNVAIPALLFRSIAGESPPASGLQIVYAYFSATLLLFAAALLLARLRFGYPLQVQSVFAITATFGNNVQLGIPLVFSAFGRAGEQPLLLIIAFHSIVLISTATALVEIGLGRGKGGLRALGRVASALVRNPLIMSIALGALFPLSGTAMPAALDQFLRLFAAAGGPCALFVLGASLAELRLVGDLAETALVGLLKLVIHPILVYASCRWVFDLPAIETAVATVCAAMPSGANAFILAQRYDLYVARAASTILVTTVISLVTLSACLALFTPSR